MAPPQFALSVVEEAPTLRAAPAACVKLPGVGALTLHASPAACVNLLENNEKNIKGKYSQELLRPQCFLRALTSRAASAAYVDPVSKATPVAGTYAGDMGTVEEYRRTKLDSISGKATSVVGSYAADRHALQ